MIDFVFFFDDFIDLFFNLIAFYFELLFLIHVLFSVMLFEKA